jgi:type I restriction enzyme, R subunit
MKVRHFLTQHENHITIQKLRRNEQLTPQDLSELERMFVAESVARPEDLERIRGEGGLGLFVRSLVGLDREIVDYLTDRGVMDPRRLYESPFTDVDDQGVSGVFTPTEVKLLVDTLAQVKAKAAA